MSITPQTRRFTLSDKEQLNLHCHVEGAPPARFGKVAYSIHDQLGQDYF